MRRFLVILVAIAVLGASAGAHAVEWRRVAMKPARTAEEIDLVRSYFSQDIGMVENFVISKTVIHKHIYLGRIDIDDDGWDEIVMLLGKDYYCGSVGCTTKLFRHDGRAWREICEDAGTKESVALADRVQAHGWRAFRMLDDVIQWVESEYGPVCMPRSEMRREKIPIPPTRRKALPSAGRGRLPSPLGVIRYD